MKNNNIDVFLSITANYDTLSKGQKRIADYVLKNSSSVMLSSLSVLAKECDTSEATIMRFLRKIGYDSYQVFRVKLAQIQKEKNDNLLNQEIKVIDSSDTIIQKVIADTTDAIKKIHTLNESNEYDKAISQILNAKKIFIIGAGSSGYIAGDLFHKLLRLGLDVVTFIDPHIQAISCAHMKSDDLLISISHSGETLSILDCLNSAQEQGSKTISITSFPNSTLSMKSDITLLSCSNETKFRPDAQKSRILQIIITDIITVLLTAKLEHKAIDNINSSQLAVARMKK